MESEKQEKKKYVKTIFGGHNGSLAGIATMCRKPLDRSSYLWTACCQLRAKIAQLTRRSVEGVSLQTVILDGVRVLSRDAFSNLQPL
jgi:hypothetical protein